MRNGKYAKHGKHSFSKKSLMLVLALVLLVGGVIGGTLAWLTDSSQTITNKFSKTDINITLKESLLKNDGTYGDPVENVTNQYQMVPGYSYKKDPVVTVDKGSEACWLFVKFEEKENASTYLTYTSMLTTQNGWTQGDGTNIPSNVWYREVNASNEDQSWHLLKDDTIAVKDTVTKENMETAAKSELVYHAYAHQLYKSNSTADGADTKFTAADAWKSLNVQ